MAFRIAAVAAELWACLYDGALSFCIAGAGAFRRAQHGGDMNLVTAALQAEAQKHT